MFLSIPLAITVGSSQMERFDSEDSPQPSFSYPDGSLWLEITGLSTNGQFANVTLHGTQPGNVYELMTKSNLTQSA